MNLKFLFHRIILSISAVLFSFQLTSAAGKYALLIGIDDYSKTSGFSNLNGPRNDIKIMRNLLGKKRYNFDKITVLLNEHATHSRVKAAFENLAAEVKKKKVGSVLIYYSGHGSLTRDLNGDEMQSADLLGNILPGYDQTWVTYGSRMKKGSSLPNNFQPIDRYDILDDQISAWLNNIASGCDQVIFISDSCYSGSVSRSGIAAGTRNGPEDHRKHPLGRKKYPPVSAQNIIRIGAGKDNQVAGEFIPIGSQEKYGIFTWYWVKVLEKCHSYDTWSDVFNQVSQIVYQETLNQQIPQIAGAVTMKVFGADILSPVQTVTVSQVSNQGERKQVILAAGCLLGVTEGSVYKLKERAKEPGAPQVHVTEVAPTHSLGVTKGDIKKYDQLIEISHHHKFLPTRLLIKVRHEKDKGKSLELLKGEIQKLAPYELVADEDSCDLIVYLFRPEKSTLPTADPVRDSIAQFEPPPSDEKAEPEIWILGRSGFLFQKKLRHSATKIGLAALRDNLLKLARAKDMLQIDSPEKSSPLKITVTPMVPASDKIQSCPDCLANPWLDKTCPAKTYKKLAPITLPDFLNRKWDLCTLLYFNAENPTRNTYYLYVVYVGNQAEIIPVFPSLKESSQIAEIRPGKVSVRGNATIRLDKKILDHYKIIICNEPINHHLFAQQEVKPVFRSAVDNLDLNPLERILINSASGIRSQVSYARDSWYARTIAIDMRR